MFCNLGLELRRVLLVLVSVPCCLLDFATVSDCIHQLLLVDLFVDLSRCSHPLWKGTPHPPPSLMMRSKKNFFTSVAVGIVPISVVSAVSYSR